MMLSAGCYKGAVTIGSPLIGTAAGSRLFATAEACSYEKQGDFARDDNALRRDCREEKITSCARCLPATLGNYLIIEKRGKTSALRIT